MLLKENPKVMNRPKSKLQCKTAVCMYALLTVHCLLHLFAMAVAVHWIHTPNPCSTSMHETTGTESAISEITNPQSYCGDDIAGEGESVNGNNCSKGGRKGGSGLVVLAAIMGGFFFYISMGMMKYLIPPG